MQYQVSNRQILKLAAPISLSILIPQVSFMANAVFLGRLGKMELVVNGLTSIFYLLLTYVGFGLSNGILVLLSRRVGARDIKGLCRTFANSILLSVAMAACIILLTIWLAPVLFIHTIHEEAIYFKTIDYLFLRMWGLPFLMLTQLVNVFFISIGRSRYLIYGALTANLINIFLDYALIFGKLGFPSMGLKGAAVASIIAEVVFCIVMYILFFNRKNYRKYPVLQYLKFDWAITRQMMKVSSPLIVQYLFGIGGWQLFYIYVEHLGVTQLAASHILRSVLGIVSIGTWALASTCNSMVSNLMGQGKPDMVIKLVRKIMTISILYTLCISFFLFVFPHTFLRFYTDKPEIVSMGILSLRVLALSSLIMSLATICFNAVVGSGNTLVNLGIELFCVAAYVVYVTIVIEKWRMPLHYGWASEFVYWGCLLMVSGIYLWSGKWKNKVI
ncbi:MATE family efflux transporter [Taibaiella lutea]|uniref:Multidrug-efflux transporter n=1 Tax=Taibaiella lutea TaxID=2608001 RepID=A0A5M6CNR4_9BACT|nr:MATE family efflux transporter [Taibaiella lutea]KAA5536683.1 MATE family efflux transporter [Taibaiella lutea]